MELRDQVLRKLTEVTATVMGIDQAAIADGTTFEADLGAKSGNLTMIITQLEDEFDVEIPYLDVKRARTVGATADLVADLCEE
jgi:acyl carrier protein